MKKLLDKLNLLEFLIQGNLEKRNHIQMLEIENQFLRENLSEAKEIIKIDEIRIARLVALNKVLSSKENGLSN